MATTTGNTGLTTLQPTGKTLPAAFQGAKAAAAFQGQEFEHASDGIEGGYPVIKYGGKVWSLAYRGETKPFLRPDDGTPRGSIDVIVVRCGATKAKTFYEKFQEGSTEKPICWSNDGAKPDPSVPTKQAAACGICPKNVFGSRITDDGKKAKACGDHKRTAVVLDPALAQQLLGMPLSESALLRIPAASLSDFATFGDTMDAQGFPLPSFITRIAFDHTKTYPKLKFEALRPLTEEEGVIAMSLRNDPSTTRIVGDVVTAVTDDGAVEPAQAGVGQVQVGAQTSPQKSAPVQREVQQAEVTPSNVVPMNVIPRPEPQPTLRPTPTQQVQAMTPDADSTQPTDFDKEIDAKIGALLS